MTPAQIAELEQLDAAIEAAPDESKPLWNRARFWAAQRRHCERVVADVEAALRLDQYHADSFQELVEKARTSWLYSRAEDDIVWLSRAQAVAYCAMIVERSPDIAGWLRPQTRGSLFEAGLQSIRDDFERQRAEEGESVEAWKVEALLTAILLDFRAGAYVYIRALELERAAGLWPGDAASYAARAEDWRADLADYQRFAWLTLAVESAPDEIDPVLRRARWLFGSRNTTRHDDGRRADARADLEWAQKRWPGDVKSYEVKWRNRRHYDMEHGNTPHDLALEYLATLRPALEAGTVSASAAEWVARARRVLECNEFPIELLCAQAVAYCDLAVASAPAAGAYLARADAVAHFYCSGEEHHWEEVNVPICYEAPPLPDEAWADYARAFALTPDTKKAELSFAALVNIISRRIRTESAHERMEALLAARQDAVNRGLPPALATRIIAEVEAVRAA